MPAPIRIGISQCLLGEKVRYDGGHKRDDGLLEALGPHVEWVPVCPEVEAGMGVPREKIRLVGDDPRSPRLVTVTSGIDHTQSMEKFSRRRLRELEALHLSGYIFKAGSPSCGIRQVPLYNKQGIEKPDGIGLFARAFMEYFPDMPVEDENRLHDSQVIQNFLERVRVYGRAKKNPRPLRERGG